MSFDYSKIITDLLKAQELHPEWRKAIGDFVYYLENSYRMHWIDDLLMEDYSETTETLANKLNITLTLK